MSQSTVCAYEATVGRAVAVALISEANECRRPEDPKAWIDLAGTDHHFNAR